jgi:hypothetical protein
VLGLALEEEPQRRRGQRAEGLAFPRQVSDRRSTEAASAEAGAAGAANGGRSRWAASTSMGQRVTGEQMRKRHGSPWIGSVSSGLWRGTVWPAVNSVCLGSSCSCTTAIDGSGAW